MVDASGPGPGIVLGSLIRDGDFVLVGGLWPELVCPVLELDSCLLASGIGKLPTGGLMIRGSG